MKRSTTNDPDDGRGNRTSNSYTKKKDKKNFELTFSRIFGIYLGGIHIFRFLLEDNSILRHDDWNSEQIFNSIKTSKEILEFSLLRRLILCSLLFTKKQKQYCRTFFTKKDMENTWKSLLALPIMEAQNAVDIVVHGNKISSIATFKKIFPPFEQAKNMGPGEFYSHLLDKRMDGGGNQEPWANDEEVLCVSSGCYAISQDESSLQYYDASNSRGKIGEVENILKKCPLEFTNYTKTLSSFHLLLVGTTLNFFVVVI